MSASAARTTRQDAERASLPEEPAAWLYAAAEALSVLSSRGPADRRRAARHATDLLAGHAEPADWDEAGLLAPTEAPLVPASRVPVDRVPVGDPAVLRMARTAALLRCSVLSGVAGVRVWSSLARFFRQAAPADPMARRIQAQALHKRMEVGDVSAEVVDGLLVAYEWHRDTYGSRAYLTSLARTNLARAYRRRATGTDLTDAEQLFREEIDARICRYGPEHPFVLVAHNLLVRCLLAQAERTGDEEERRALALQAYAEADRVRAARDLIYGATSPNAVLSRRHQGYALLILGDADSLKRARVCLRYVLDFETARNDNSEWRGSGPTHLLLARVCLALGDRPAALGHARSAHRLLSADAPADEFCQGAAAFVQRLSDEEFHNVAGFAGIRPVPGEASRIMS